MRRSPFAALAATVALPALVTSAAAQQGWGGPYAPGEYPDPPHTPDRYITDWDDARERGRRAGPGYLPGEYPNPPYTPDRYITDWSDARGRADRARQGRTPQGYPNPPRTPGRYITDWDDARERHLHGYGVYAPDDGRRGARWSEGPPRAPEFGGRYGGDERGAHRRGYRGERGFDPDARYSRTGPERRHDEMHARGQGYRDHDFRRDFREDGRRGYYQDPAYEVMPSERARVHEHGMRGGRDVPDMARMRRAMRMIDTYDIDRDGRVTQEEVDRFRADRLQSFDRDDDDALTLQEYERLWLDAMRERMVDRFQRHDDDGDGMVTVEEFGSRTRHLVRSYDRDRDRALTEGDWFAPVVEAPLGGSPNEPAQTRVPGDEDVSEGGIRPEVEAPLGGAPNEPAGDATAGGAENAGADDAGVANDADGTEADGNGGAAD